MAQPPEELGLPVWGRGGIAGAGPPHLLQDDRAALRCLRDRPVLRFDEGDALVDGSPARVPGMDVREYPVPQPEQSAVIEIPPTGLAGRDGPAGLGRQSLDLGREPVEGVAPGEQALVSQYEPLDPCAFGWRGRSLARELGLVVPVEPGDHRGEAARAPGEVGGGACRPSTR